MKKTVTTLLVVATVFLCTNYYVKADEVIDSTRRYNWLSTTQHYGNVDITGNLFCLSDNPAMQSVDLSSVAYVQNGSTGTVLSTWESCYVWKFQATYVIRNTSNNFEVFDNARFYSNWQFTAKASSNSGPSGGLTDEMVPSGWYIDNIQGTTLTNALADGTLYFSIDDLYYGNSIILAPGEVRTFSYDINVAWWEQSFGVGGVSASAQNGSISNTMGYTQQDGYHSYTVEQFINTGMVTSNAVAFYQQMIEQGIEDQTLYNEIIDYLRPNSYYYDLNVPSSSNSILYQYDSETTPLSLFYHLNYAYSFQPYLVNSDIDSLNVDSTGYSGVFNDVWAFPVHYRISFDNRRNKAITSSRTYYQFNLGHDFTSNGNYIGANLSNLFEKGIYLAKLSPNFSGTIYAEDPIGGLLYPAYSTSYVEFTITYYFVISDYDDSHSGLVINNPSAFNVTDRSTQSYSLVDQTVPYVGSNVFNFWDIRNKIQAIIDAYNANQPAAEDVTDASEDMTDQADTQHQQEVALFDQNDTAMDNSGLGTFTFNADQVSGIGTSATMFTSIWNMLGPWSGFIIFILTLRLATLILRHKPKSES